MKHRERSPVNLSRMTRAMIQCYINQELLDHADRLSFSFLREGIEELGKLREISNASGTGVL